MTWLLVIFALANGDWTQYRQYQFRTEAQCLVALESGYWHVRAKGARIVMAACVEGR